MIRFERISVCSPAAERNATGNRLFQFRIGIAGE